MKRFFRLGFGCMLVGALTFAGYYEYSTHVMRGWLRGEAFYEGRPTSYWRGIVEDDLQRDPRELTRKLHAYAPRTWWQTAKEKLGLKAEPHSSSQLIAYDFRFDPDRDETAGLFAVLRELAQDPNEKIAGFATDAPKHSPWTMPESYWLSVIAKHSLRTTK